MPKKIVSFVAKTGKMIRPKQGVSTSVKRYVNKKIDNQIEDKQLITQFANPTTSDVVGQVVLLNGITQGVDQNNRVGNRVRMKYARIRINLSQASNTPASIRESMHRIIIFIDKQANGALPASSDLLTTTGATAEEYLSPIKIQSKKRFQILYDRYHTLQVHGGSVNVPQTTSIEIKLKLKKKIVQYKGTTNGITDLQTNSLLFLHVCDTSSGAVNPIEFDGFTDLIYEDA